jgi:hypothetical protein
MSLISLGKVPQVATSLGCSMSMTNWDADCKSSCTVCIWICELQLQLFVECDIKLLAANSLMCFARDSWNSADEMLSHYNA